MKIVCYAFKDEKGVLKSPFLKYLKKYEIKPNESEKKRLKKVNQLMNINGHLLYLLENKGNYCLPPIVQKYKNQNIGILKMKEGNYLVRVAFFTVINEMIVILDAFDKPRFYEKNQKRKIAKKIKKFLNLSETYLQDFFKNHIYIPLNI